MRFICRTACNLETALQLASKRVLKKCMGLIVRLERCAPWPSRLPADRAAGRLADELVAMKRWFAVQPKAGKSLYQNG